MDFFNHLLEMKMGGIIDGLGSLAQSADQTAGTQMQLGGAQGTAQSDMSEMMQMAQTQRQFALVGAVTDLLKTGASQIENAARKA